MSLDVSDPRIWTEYRALTRKDSPIDWCSFGYAPPPSGTSSRGRKLIWTGSGHRCDRVSSHSHSPDEVTFGLVKTHAAGALSLWTSIPESVTGVLRARALVDSRSIANAFPPHSHAFLATGQPDLDRHLSHLLQLDDRNHDRVHVHEGKGKGRAFESNPPQFDLLHEYRDRDDETPPRVPDKPRPSPPSRSPSSATTVKTLTGPPPLLGAPLAGRVPVSTPDDDYARTDASPPPSSPPPPPPPPPIHPRHGVPVRDEDDDDQQQQQQDDTIDGKAQEEFARVMMIDHDDDDYEPTSSSSLSRRLSASASASPSRRDETCRRRQSREGDQDDSSWPSSSFEPDSKPDDPPLEPEPETESDQSPEVVVIESGGHDVSSVAATAAVKENEEAYDHDGHRYGGVREEEEDDNEDDDDEDVDEEARQGEEEEEEEDERVRQSPWDVTRRRTTTTTLDDRYGLTRGEQDEGGSHETHGGLAAAAPTREDDQSRVEDEEADDILESYRGARDEDGEGRHDTKRSRVDEEEETRSKAGFDAALIAGGRDRERIEQERYTAVHTKVPQDEYDDEETRRAQEEMRLMVERAKLEDKLRDEEREREVELAKARARDRTKRDLTDKRDSGRVMASGEVSVQGARSMLWRRRYFELTADTLSFFKSQAERAKPLDAVRTATVRSIVAFPDEPLPPHSFKVAVESDEGGEDDWLLYGDDEEQKELLIAGLQIAAGLPS